MKGNYMAIFPGARLLFQEIRVNASGMTEEEA